MDLAELLDPESRPVGASRPALQGEWRAEKLRDSNWFREDWVKDAVSMHVARLQQNGFGKQ